MSLFDNAVNSIVMGVEDSRSNDAKRKTSAVRNLYAGVLLLAKEVLVRSVPNANEADVLAVDFKPKPDGKGGIVLEPNESRTIDFYGIEQRFKAFGLKIDHKALVDLQKVRNSVEHLYWQQSAQAVDDAIAKALPVVTELFSLAREKPHQHLGDAWQYMLDVGEVYNKTKAECADTFANVEWESDLLAEAPFKCNECDSELVSQIDPKNTEKQSTDCECRRCGNLMDAETAVQHALSEHFAEENYRAVKDGGDAIIGTCPECSLETYLEHPEENGCAWCDCVLGECSMCSTQLSPNNVAFDNSSMCSYCDNLMSKDD